MSQKNLKIWLAVNLWWTPPTPHINSLEAFCRFFVLGATPSFETKLTAAPFSSGYEATQGGLSRSINWRMSKQEMQLKGDQRPGGCWGETRSWLCTSLKRQKGSGRVLCSPPISSQSFCVSVPWDMELHVIKSVLDACRDKWVLRKGRENTKYSWEVPSGSVLHSAAIPAQGWNTGGCAQPLLLLPAPQKIHEQKKSGAAERTNGTKSSLTFIKSEVLNHYKRIYLENSLDVSKSTSSLLLTVIRSYWQVSISIHTILIHIISTHCINCRYHPIKKIKVALI